MPLIELLVFLTRRISSFVYKALYLRDGTAGVLIRIPAAAYQSFVDALIPPATYAQENK